MLACTNCGWDIQLLKILLQQILLTTNCGICKNHSQVSRLVRRTTRTRETPSHVWSHSMRSGWKMLWRNSSWTSVYCCVESDDFGWWQRPRVSNIFHRECLQRRPHQEFNFETELYCGIWTIEETTILGWSHQEQRKTVAPQITVHFGE